MTPRTPRSHRALAGASVARSVVNAACVLALASCSGEKATAPASTTYVAELNGANERPERPTTGTGRATFVVDGGVASYAVVVTGLAGAATVAHVVIGGAQTAVGQVVVSMPVTSPVGTISSGTIDLGRPVTYNNSTISGDSLRSLFDRGTAYVNVYTTTYPGGEVRGQILRRE